MPENYLTVGLIEKYSGILLDGEGAIQAQGLDMVIKMEDLEDTRQEITEKLMIYVSYGKRVQRSKS